MDERYGSGGPGGGNGVPQGPGEREAVTAELPRRAPEPPRGPFDGHDGPDVPHAPYVPPPPGDRRGRSQRRGTGALVATVAGLSLLLGLGGGIAGAALVDRLGADGSGAVVSPSGEGPVVAPGAAGGEGAPVRDPDSVAGVAARVLPSVVSIEVSSGQGQGSGSGFVIDAEGLVLTNNHVIASALQGGDVEVVFADGTREPAELVGRTDRYDLAVLRVERDGLAPLAFAEEEVVVGDPVVAIGAPLGLQSTVTSGIVSALDRPVSAGGQAPGAEPSFMNAVQTDAAINPGNSGGPLVDLEGRVVGVNSAIAQAPGSQGGNIGLGFAIPAEQAVRTSQEIVDTGEATFPLIGVVPEPTDDGPGVPIATQADQPPITPGGPADEAGIRPGDVILEVEGRPVDEAVELIVAITSQRPGDTITLVVQRDGETREVDVLLDDTEVG
jgi:putative serine protease PepD